MAIINETGAALHAAPVTWRGELASLFALAWPLVIAQLAQMALFTTDVIMVGWLGPQYLAASTLATAFFNMLLIGGFGLVGAVAPMVAQAIGAGDVKSVRRTVRQGLWVAIALAALVVPLVWQIRPILHTLGQSEELSALAETFMHSAAWLAFPALMLIVLRSFLAAKGSSRVILVITVTGVFVNAVGDYLLIFGNFGFPRLELRGAGISTTTVNVVMFLLTLGYVLLNRKYRRYHILARFWVPDWQRFFQLLRLGAPIGLMVMSEIGIFTVASLLMGLLGTDQVAAHAVALQCAALAFMVPLGLSQATTVRVGRAFGAGSAEGIRKAGWTSFGLTMVFMASTCLLFVLFPHRLVAFFLDPANPKNAAALGFAATYLGVAALFQLVDGAQVIAAATLRGLSDTAVPMFVAIIGYWVLGLPIAYFCGFVLGWQGVGIWLGLAAGLAFVAVVLTTRFALRGRLRLLGDLQA
ncbi:MAG: Multidrug and toxin extrusion family efflux pump [Hyphomicrobiales bacterium]|nr:Multidrug and toxin extrusion family efflux pump [Hyphomicrobiales bacterium]